MSDKYRNFSELAKKEMEGRDFCVRLRKRPGTTVVIAPHGGGIALRDLAYRPRGFLAAIEVGAQVLELFRAQALGVEAARRVFNAYAPPPTRASAKQTIAQNSGYSYPPPLAVNTQPLPTWPR